MGHVKMYRESFLTRMEDEVKGYQVETFFGPGECPNRDLEYEGFACELKKNEKKRPIDLCQGFHFSILS